jgi:uncharacterized protein (TIGR03435 family)
MLKTGILIVLTTLAFGQSFEVASIKPSDAPCCSSGINTTNGLMRATNVTLMRCIIGAYGLPQSQIIGGPKWLDDLRFDIVARSADRSAGDPELMTMLQSLLADRFHLAFHRGTQTVSGYTLTIAKGGITAQESDPNVSATTNSSRGRIDAKGCPMSRLIIRLSGLVGAPVVDMTDDKRNFDFSLQWVPDDMQARSNSSAPVPDGPSLFTALQEQMGLKLEAKKIPVQILIIDHADMPSDN